MWDSWAVGKSGFQRRLHSELMCELLFGVKFSAKEKFLKVPLFPIPQIKREWSGSI